jgi:methanogenic corrinoid protein MtbC1
MPVTAREVGSAISSRHVRIVEDIVSQQYLTHPELTSRYGESGRAKCLQDTAFHLSHLVQAVISERATLFADYLRWALVVLESRGIPVRDLHASLQHMKQSLRSRIPVKAAAHACGLIDEAWRLANADAVPAEQPLEAGSLAARYLEALLAGRRDAAQTLVVRSLEEGMSLHDVYLGVLEPAQHELGRLWQSNRITVAEEHYCTASTQQLMSRLYPRIARSGPPRATMVAACAPGELHEIGIRMVCDLLEMEGWDTYFLGANMPVQDLLQFVASRRPDVLALSATVSYHVQALQRIIESARAHPDCSSVRIIVGGHPFKRVPDLWASTGADAFAPDAASALRATRTLLTGSRQ